MKSTCLLTSILLVVAACGGDDEDSMDTSATDTSTTTDTSGDSSSGDTQAPTTTASVTSGTYLKVPTQVVLAADEAATIYYTVDGSDPTTASASAQSPAVVTDLAADTALKFFAVDAASNTESIKSETYSVGAAAGDITVSAISATPVVTVNNQPNGFTLAGTATWNDGTDELTISLELTNTGPALFGLKFFPTSPSVGAFGNGDGTIGTDDFRYYGPHPMFPADKRSLDFVFTGIDGSADLNFNFSLRSDPVIYYAGSFDTAIWAFDSTGAIADATEITCEDVTFAPSLAEGGGDCKINDAVLSPDQKTIYGGNRVMPNLVIIDTATGSISASASFSQVANSTNGVGSTFSPTYSPDKQFIYLVLNDNAHNYIFDGADVSCNESCNTSFAPMGGTPTVELLKLNASDLSVAGRVTVLAAGDNDNSITGRRIGLSPDGNTAAVPLMHGGAVALVNTSDMTVIDTDSGTGGTQNLDLSAVGDGLRFAVFSADNARLYAAIGNAASDNHVVSVALSDYAATPLTVAGAVDPGEMLLGPDSKIWLLHHETTLDALYTIDPTDSDTVASKFPVGTYGAEHDVICLSPDASWYAFGGDGTGDFVLWDVMGDSQIDADGDGGNGVTSPATNGQIDRHNCLIGE